MQLPSEVPLMTLPNAILFPEAMLPLYIFEPRYRQMLSDALHSNRMFSVALQKPGRKRETPCQVAGLGLIRASVSGRDGTSHLVLQGLARVELGEAVRYKPYRVQQIRALPTTDSDGIDLKSLVTRVLELVGLRLSQGSGLPAKVIAAIERKAASQGGPKFISGGQIVEFLQHLPDNPGRLADLVSCALLPRPEERQKILETANLEQRLLRLIEFLSNEIKQQSQHPSE